MFRIAFQDVKTVGIRNKAISKLYQHFRERDFPYGLQNALCTLALQYCSRLTPLRSRTNTRYGRAANPYPTGTLTRQETPSFARRDNVFSVETGRSGVSPPRAVRVLDRISPARHPPANLQRPPPPSGAPANITTSVLTDGGGFTAWLTDVSGKAAAKSALLFDGLQELDLSESAFHQHRARSG